MRRVRLVGLDRRWPARKTRLVRRAAAGEEEAVLLTGEGGMDESAEWASGEDVRWVAVVSRVEGLCESGCEAGVDEPETVAEGGYEYDGEAVSASSGFESQYDSICTMDG